MAGFVIVVIATSITQITNWWRRDVSASYVAVRRELAMPAGVQVSQIV